MARIGNREDVSPAEGKREYGDVEFAEATNKKYERIRKAAPKFDVEIED
jgi:hypothetical protein